MDKMFSFYFLRSFIGSELTPKYWKASVLVGHVCTHKEKVGAESV